MTRLYLPASLAVGHTVALPDSAVRHLIQVLRMGNGERLTVFNGRGGEYQAQLRDVGRRSANLQVTEFDPITRESPYRVTIAQCISKGDRMDYALQKATECGAYAFVPVLSARGVVKVDDERFDKKVEHWRGVVIAAAEQSGRTHVPQVSAPMRLDAVVQHADSPLKLILAPGGGKRLSTLAQAEHLTVLIGPEGGFAPEELDLAELQGWLRLGLGARILRTETAPVAFLAALAMQYGDC